MEKKKIKWGNIFILLLLIAAAIYAFKYTDIGGNHRSNENNVQDKVDATSARDVENGNVKGDETNAQLVENDLPAPGEFVMGLDSWIGGTPALMALSREYNRDYSLDLKIKFISSDSERIEALSKGIIHATEISLPSLVKQLTKFPDSCVIIGITDFSRGADGIVSKAEVKDLNDMEGRKVSFVKDGTGKFILNKFLRLTGLRYQDIIPVECEDMDEVIDDLKTGSSDLAVSWSPDMNIAVRDINGDGKKKVKMLITTKEVPNLIPTVLVVNKKVLENPEQVDAFLKTWYASAKYIIEKPEKAHQKLVELMNENSDEYGKVSLEDVNDSFTNIKLMALNDNYGYFGLDGKNATLVSIINDTVQTWKKYGDIEQALDSTSIYKSDFMQKLKTENDSELLVAYDEGQKGSDTSAGETEKSFEKQDEKSIEKNTEKVAKIDIPPVFYNSGKATVKQDSLAVLDQVVDISKQFPEYYILIDAHTDSVGSDESNLKLSSNRADEVKKYLVSKGVNANRIVSRGWGEYKPVVAVEKSEEDKAKNRRTEFTLTRIIDK
jgi:Outer membrane protein and related peptidoglycan-associated (lipo)proteins